MSDRPKHAGKHSEACQSGFPDHDCPICGSSLPKPYALGECDSVIDKRPFNRSLSLKPTGEWTPLKGDETVLDMGVYGKLVLGESHTRKIADAHNAALAAQGREVDPVAVQLLQHNDKEIQQLREQLAAEREKVVRMHNLLRNLQRDENQLREQLAAERELRKRWERKTEETLMQLAVERDLGTTMVGGMMQELAAEREKVTLATQMVQIESKRANEAEQK